MLMPYSRILLQVALVVLLICQICKTMHAQTVPVMKQRLIRMAQSRDAYLPHSYDTFVFKYSTKRSSDFVPHNFNIGQTFGYRWFVAPEGASAVKLPAPMFDINAINVHFDTCYRFNTLVTTTDTTSLTERRYTVYNEQDRIVESDEQSYQRMKRLVSYNSHGDAEKVIVLRYNPARPAPDTYLVRTIIYDEQNYAIADSVNYIEPSASDYVNTYEYDDKKRVIGTLRQEYYLGNWKNTNKQRLFYDANGVFLGRAHFLWMNNNWDSSNAMYLRYDTEGRLVRSVDSIVRPTSSSRTFFTLHYNNLGLVDTLYYGGVSLTSYSRTIFYYNKYYNPDSAYRYVTNDDGKTYYLDYTVKYYYEEYEDTTITVPQGDIVIYPNPATDKITIRWNSKRPTTPVYAMLYAANGQLVRSVYIPQIGDDNEIEISGIAAGVYYLRILTPLGGKLYTGGISVAGY